jgi:hypothetical protein
MGLDACGTPDIISFYWIEMKLIKLFCENNTSVISNYRPWGLRSSLILDPFDFSDWMAIPGNWNLKEPITRGEISSVVNQKQFDSRPMQGHSVSFDANRKYHIERISYFIIHGFGNSDLMNSIQINSNHGIKWPVVNGNHRMVAAKFLDWPTIPVWIQYNDPLIAADLAKLDQQTIDQWINQWNP